MSTLGGLVRQHRSRRGWTQVDLARRLGGTHQTAISQWENGEWYGCWSRFDDLAELFDYPDDLVLWWADYELNATEDVIRKARSLKEQLARRARPDETLAKLDGVIERHRLVLTELMELRQALESAN